MDTVIETNALSPKRRLTAFREAVCDTYAHVDVSAENLSGYNALLKKAEFGRINLTECAASPQAVERRKSHILCSDRECHFVQLMHHGRSDINQNDTAVAGTRGIGILFSPMSPYKMQWVTQSKALYIDVPAHALTERYPSRGTLMFQSFDAGNGLGRVLIDFAAALVDQATHVQAADRAKLGEQLIDLLSAALLAAAGKRPLNETSIQRFRLEAIESYIEENLSDPSLSLTTVAKSNGISLRYLHRLFQLKSTSPADWIWSRRLYRGNDMLSSQDFDHLSITEIAFSLGFSSSSHFSNAFRDTFGISPSEVRRTSRALRGTISGAQMLV
jgi:AraC-like DNA-binding protein